MTQSERAAPPSNRIYFIDAARAALMFLGIPYHTCLAYSHFSSWTVKSDDLSYIASCIGAFIHAFRMPAFFVIAGYFSVLILRKRGPRGWFAYRLPRLVIPMLTIGLLVNPFVMLGRSVGRVSGPQIETDWLDQLTTIGSHWVAQLWFLGDLLLYSILLVAIAFATSIPLVRRVGAWLEAYSLRNLWTNLGLIFGLGILVTLAAIATKLLGLSQFANGFIFPSRTFAQMPFFFFGAFLALSARHLDDFTTFKRALILPTLIGCLIFAFLTDREDAPSVLVTFFITPAVGLASAQMIFSVARGWLNKPSRIVKLGVDSSMTVYLIHMIFVVWLVLLFRLVSAPPFVEVIVISVIATGLSVSVSLIANRVPLLFFALHGHRAKPRAPPAGSSLLIHP